MVPTVLESCGGESAPQWIPAAFGSLAESRGAILTGGPPPADLAARLADGGRIALLVSGSPPPVLERAPVWVRALRAARLAAASARLRLRLARLERRLADGGAARRRLLIGDREDGYELGVGSLRVGLPVEAVLVLSRAEQPTLLELVVEQASGVVGTRLELRSCRVLAAGTLLAELGDELSRSWFLRFHADPAEAEGTPATIELLESSPPEAVRGRLVATEAAGIDGGLGWSLEPKVEGTHPAGMSPGLWRECAGFLTALASVAPRGAAPPLPLADDAKLLAAHLDAAGRERVAKLADEADRLLAPLPRHWGHGDFHPGNLIVRDGRLAAVLDWDAASPAALPGLDLLHLIATTDPALRRLPHGGRCSGPLQEAALGQGGGELRAWLAGIGVEPEEPTIRALVVAYWLGRVARDLRTFGDRSSRGQWIELNVVRPAAAVPAPRGSDT
jgi:hypothetical protein